jgi:GAF domain-containing protein
MRRRSRKGGEPVKARSRKTATPKRRNAPKSADDRSSSAAGQKTKTESEVARLSRERDEALEQLSAASDVLKVISASPGDLKPVFEAILENATRICEAKFGTLVLCEGDAYRVVAMHNAPPAYVEARRRDPMLSMTGNTTLARVATTKRAAQDTDILKHPAYNSDSQRRSFVALTGARSLIHVPMLKDNELVGAIGVYRQEVRPFTDKQITLLTNFAAQAVIAIENTRLLNELRESLEQQTATSEVLSVISSSPGELEPVFQTMLANAVRICDAKFGLMHRYDGDAFHIAALQGMPPDYAEVVRREAIRPGPETVLARMARTKQVAQVKDARGERGYADRDPMFVAAVELGGVRTILSVPMLKDDAFIGAIIIYRQEVRPFTDKQIELVKNFAAQAVIAIENTRLLNELRESLEQQTATSEVLKAISTSPGELEPVFQAMLENAVRICGAKFGSLYLHGEDGLTIVATHNAPPAFAEARRRGPIQPPPNAPLGQVIRTKQTARFADLATTQAYTEGNPAVVAAVELGGIRTVVAVPMLKDDTLLGVIAIYRQEVRPFSDKQVALLANFAAQAVIAIENTRLLNELRQRTDDLTESLEQQTATSEVLRVISSSPGDLEPVFQAMLTNATRICEASFGLLQLHEGGAFRTGAMHNVPAAFAQAVAQRGPLLHPGPLHPLARVIATKQLLHIFDFAEDPAYKQREPAAVRLVELAGARTFLAVPMLKDDVLVGAIVIYRQEVGPFTDKQIALVQNFAAQAVIAIENTRLLNELRESLEQQTATSEVLGVISSSPGELETVFQAMLENAVRICDAKLGVLHRHDNEMFNPVAHFGVTPEHAEFMRQRGSFQPTAGSGLDRVLRTKELVHTADVSADPSTAMGAPARFGGARSLIQVPMLKDNTLIGAISIYRQEVRPFTDKQIELVKNFAAQAVIAIENTRLLKELRERTDQLEVQSQEVVKLNQQLEQRVADQVGEIERMGRLRRFLSPQVADLIVASGTERQLESHRREITALFCDLRGFTGFSESSDPEDVMALLREYHAAIGEIIIKYSGTLERFAGDGVMVVFNDPVPVANPALQAVQMALDMRVAIGALIEKWSRLGHDLGFGIGIAHGFATLGTIGFEGRFDYAAIGTVANVASRLCDEAKPGQILISPRVLMAVEAAVTAEPVGEFTLKGIRRPLAAYNVLAALSSKN